MDKHFVVSNFNTVPSYYLDSFSNVTIYDQSDNEEIIDILLNKHDARIRFEGKTCGHNLLNYLDYILENYDNLPQVVVFTKGNVPGRHCSDEWLSKAIGRDCYEFLWDDPNLKDKQDIQHRLYPGRYIEINNSWYVKDSPHRYFTNFDDFCDFIFLDYKKSRFNLFSPGACYQVERDRITRNPKSLYEGLRRIIEYTFRPAECFMLERALNLIFDRTYNLRDYCMDSDRLMYEISHLPDKTLWRARSRKSALEKTLELLIYRLEKLKRQIAEARNVFQ